MAITLNVKTSPLIPMKDMKHGQIGVIESGPYKGYVVLYNNYHKQIFAITSTGSFDSFLKSTDFLVRLLSDGESITLTP